MAFVIIVETLGVQQHVQEAPQLVPPRGLSFTREV